MVRTSIARPARPRRRHSGLAIYFTPAVALLTGPVFLFEPDLQPGGNSWMWSAQLDVDLDFKPSEAEAP